MCTNAPEAPPSAEKAANMGSAMSYTVPTAENISRTIASCSSVAYFPPQTALAAACTRALMFGITRTTPTPSGSCAS